MFGEKEYERSLKSRQEIPVTQSSKYIASRDKALKALEERKYLKESDFWILKNETNYGKMMYTGLIISHNACLKINDNLPEKDKFNPDCVSVDKTGYGNSLVFTMSTGNKAYTRSARHPLKIARMRTLMQWHTNVCLTVLF